jgi:hypothetical protein
MRASEILRGLADLIDSAEGGQAPAITPQQSGQIIVSKFTPVNQEPASIQDLGTFVPPLQAKIELLKKAVGVDNIYDEKVGKVSQDPEASNHKVTPMSSEETDALARMKKAAGVNALITHELSDDEPLES